MRSRASYFLGQNVRNCLIFGQNDTIVQKPPIVHFLKIGTATFWRKITTIQLFETTSVLRNSEMHPEKRRAMQTRIGMKKTFTILKMEEKTDQVIKLVRIGSGFYSNSTSN